MRLLHTVTFKLESFFDEELRSYAILSHTWGKEAEEITLQELQQEDVAILLNSTKLRIVNGEPLQSFQSIKKGFLKIIGCALQAEKDGFEYIWCDTCCIDKTNSTELSEAINSMYLWYKGRLCYAYLADVPHATHQGSIDGESTFTSSKWFTRGWTLQELIAPSNVVFFDKTWHLMGTRSDFKESIAEKTGIDREVLEGEDPALSSIAERMLWASQRKTTRIEDLAYCLMGLFGVNMPLIYGEKHKAFLRLQTEIMKTSEDHSLFAWKTPEAPSNVNCGLLASFPEFFAESRHIRPISRHEISDYMTQPPFSMTNRGVSISLSMLQVIDVPGLYVAILDCQDATDGRGPLGIFLHGNKGGSYRRRYPHKLIRAIDLRDGYNYAHTKTIYIAQEDIIPRAGVNSVYCFHIPQLPEELLQHGTVLTVFPNKRTASWDLENRLLRCSQGLAASIYLCGAAAIGKVLFIGVDSRLRALCFFDIESDTSYWRYNRKLEVRDYPIVKLEPRQLPLIKDWLAIKLSLEAKDWGQNVRHGINPSGKTSTSLELGTWTAVERNQLEVIEFHKWKPWKPKMRHSKDHDQVFNTVNFEVSIALTEEIVKGQKMFVVNFSIGDTSHTRGGSSSCSES